MRKDQSRIRNRPGIFARLRSFVLDVLPASSVTDLSEAGYANSVRLDRLLAYAAM